MSSVCLSVLDDEALVMFAKDGNHKAFEELWNRHFRRVFRTVSRITQNPSDAEDALQDTFLRAYSHLDKFGCRSRFSTWLTRIAINSALMILRHKRSHPYTSLHSTVDGEVWEEWDVPDRNVDIEGSYARMEASLQLKASIHKLRPPLRDVLQIHQRNDGPLEETAALAGLSVPATKTRLLRARMALRKTLTQQVRLRA